MGDKMKKIVIFGAGDNAELARYYFENDEKYKNVYKVEAFTVQKEYIESDEFKGLPLVEFEQLEKKYPPEKFCLFIAIGYTSMNEVREKIYKNAKERGYKFVNYISSKANVFTDDIGENNFILEDNTIQPFVKIGNNNVIWSGSHIGHHGTIGNHCFITSHVVISGRCVIEDNCFLGVNSTLRDHIRVKYKTLIAAGVWISKDTEEYGVYLPPQSTKIDKKSTEIKIS